jgi:hypothetical protein
VTLLRQTRFPEPEMRVNTDPAARYAGGWDEEAAWGEYAGSLIATSVNAHERVELASSS